MKKTVSMILVVALCMALYGCFEPEPTEIRSTTTAPTGSVVPTNLTEPAETTQFTEPTLSAESTAPTEPTDPIEPTEPTDPIEPTEPTEPAMEPTEDHGRDYVLNNNTMKFHYPSCSSAKNIKESNKAYYHGTREELIEKGYSPCGRCHP